MKPVELTIANTVHDTAEAIESLPIPGAAAVDIDAIAKSLARTMLCRLAHDAADHLVLRALAALGAPCTHEALAQRLRLALDNRATERRDTPADPIPEATHEGGTA